MARASSSLDTPRSAIISRSSSTTFVVIFTPRSAWMSCVSISSHASSSRSPADSMPSTDRPNTFCDFDSRPRNLPMRPTAGSIVSCGFGSASAGFGFSVGAGVSVRALSAASTTAVAAAAASSASCLSTSSGSACSTTGISSESGNSSTSSWNSSSFSNEPSSSVSATSLACSSRSLWAFWGAGSSLWSLVVSLSDFCGFSEASSAATASSDFSWAAARDCCFFPRCFWRFCGLFRFCRPGFDGSGCSAGWGAFATSSFSGSSSAAGFFAG